MVSLSPHFSPFSLNFIELIIKFDLLLIYLVDLVMYDLVM